MLEWISKPWPWYIAGPLIGLTVPILLILGNKPFGISSSLRHLCAACIPNKIDFFSYDWKKEVWNLYFVMGIAIGGFIANSLMSNTIFEIDKDAIVWLSNHGIKDFSSLIPKDIFSWESFKRLKGFVFIAIGGFAVGFGTRYAGGCTSGHSIMGLSNLQWPSLVATICFMIGGILTNWLLLPFLLSF
jgi:hypothetical protein